MTQTNLEIVGSARFFSSLLGFRSRGGIGAMALTMSLVQLFDAVIGVLLHDSSKTYGPLFLALIGFVSVAFSLRSC
jgi:hypothetical protein